MTDEATLLSGGFFVKHLKGEYSLPRSFWLNMILISWLLPMAAVILQGLTSPKVPPRIASAEYLLVTAVSVLLSYWGMIGTIHSGRRFLKNGGSKLWYIPALTVACILAIDTILPVFVAPGVLVQNVRVVFTGRY